MLLGSARAPWARRALLAPLLLTSLALCACQGAPDTGRARPAALEASEPPAEALAPTLEQHEPAAAAARAGLDLVHLDELGALVLAGQVEYVPPDTDAERIVTLAAEQPAELAALASLRVADARFVEGGVAFISDEGTLRFLPLGAALDQAVTLDAQVIPPLSVSGARVAYARGEMPFYELALADVRSGAVTAITRDMAPAYSPALSPAGDALVFVSTLSGVAALYRVDTRPGAQPEPLIHSERTPSSILAPRWDGASTLTFDDEAGRVSLDLATGALSTLEAR